MDKAFSRMLLICLYLKRLLQRYRDVNFRNGQKLEFFRTFWPTLWKPLGQRGWLNARMCAGLCPTYAIAFDDAEENIMAAVPLAYANRCHFRDYKALLVASLTHVSGATVASVQTFTFKFSKKKPTAFPLVCL